MRRCKCGCKETVCVPKDYIEHVPCEVAYHCKQCGTLANYWAYGAYMEPETKTGMIRYIWATESDKAFWWKLMMSLREL